MALRGITSIPRNLQRVIEILRSLWRHGLGHIVNRLGVQEHLPFVARIVAGRKGELLEPDDETIARRLVLVFQELGPTFIKFAQLLSTRPDFVPDPYLSEFRKLQDDVKPFPTREARQIIESELGVAVDEVFSEFPDDPVAAGSIAQVYRARLRDGKAVIVKVQRPGIARTISSDIDILMYLAKHAERNWPETSPVIIVQEFERAIRKELDFLVEASYTAKFREFVKDLPGVVSPSVYWDYTSRLVLTVEYISGFRPTPEEARRRGFDPKSLAKMLGRVFIKQYVDFGLFHADPHPGNILITDTGDVALVDFGMTGHITEDLLSDLSSALIAVTRQNFDILIDIYADITEAGLADAGKLKPDLVELFDKYYGMPLKHIDMGQMFNDSLRIAREHGLTMPRDLVMLMRSLVIVTSVAQSLDPDFNMAALLQPEAKRLVLRKMSPRKSVSEAGMQLWHTSRIIRKLPAHLRNIVQKIESGTLAVAFKHQGLESLISELDRVSNRLSVSLILGSTIVGSSIALHAEVLPIRGISALGVAGFIVAALLGMWLVWDILRSGRY